VHYKAVISVKRSCQWTFQRSRWLSSILFQIWSCINLTHSSARLWKLLLRINICFKATLSPIDGMVSYQSIVQLVSGNTLCDATLLTERSFVLFPSVHLYQGRYQECLQRSMVQCNLLKIEV